MAQSVSGTSKSVITKEEITQKILQGLPEDDRPTYDEACKSWWMNFREGGGFRLTNAGYMAIGTCDLETYSFNAPTNLVAIARHLLTLDKKLDCPYYIKIGKSPQIILFGSKQAVMLAMYGDLNKWMNFLNRT
jgi:hypothetical protein